MGREQNPEVTNKGITDRLGTLAAQIRSSLHELGPRLSGALPLKEGSRAATELQADLKRLEALKAEAAKLINMATERGLHNHEKVAVAKNFAQRVTAVLNRNMSPEEAEREFPLPEVSLLHTLKDAFSILLNALMAALGLNKAEGKRESMVIKEGATSATPRPGERATEKAKATSVAHDDDPTSIINLADSPAAAPGRTGMSPNQHENPTNHS